MAKEEIWKTIHLKKYANNYLVSNYGRIKNKRTSQILKTNCIRSGYKSICLQNNIAGKKTYKIHILVAKLFVKNPHHKKLVNHIDGNKFNNYYKNLSWVTARENVQHAIDNKLITTFNRRVVQYDMNNNKIASYPSAKIAMTKTGVNRCSICHVCQGRRKSAGGYIWKYKKENKNRCEIDTTKYKSVPNFPNYVVLPNSKIYSIKYKKFLKPTKNADGYYSINLSNNSKHKSYLVHRLVAMLYIKNTNPDWNIHVNHIDGNKTNNKKSNLEWISPSENSLHYYRVIKPTTTKQHE